MGCGYSCAVSVAEIHLFNQCDVSIRVKSQEMRSYKVF